jgi:hypothetical protein
MLVFLTAVEDAGSRKEYAAAFRRLWNWLGNWIASSNQNRNIITVNHFDVILSFNWTVGQSLACMFLKMVALLFHSSKWQWKALLTVPDVHADWGLKYQVISLDQVRSWLECLSEFELKSLRGKIFRSVSAMRR